MNPEKELLRSLWVGFHNGRLPLCSNTLPDPPEPEMLAHRPLSSSFLGLPYRILHMNPEKELLRSLWVGFHNRRLLVRLPEHA